ncbi:Arc family DNA-binding protein [Agrobacterium genomosp. 13]|uniref:Arc family DNA-binding protein n=1 Tax=Agrobacterium genomosp. 13 TaxID=1183419 RepID=UPI0011187A03|nr:Arc family DNA-binding protein [Agrobacterium genomosp. 13]
MGVNRTNTDQFQLRLPPGLRDRIKAHADRHGRSTNAEIVRILEREFPEPEIIENQLTDLLDVLEIFRKGDGNAAIAEFLTKAHDVLDAVAHGSVEGISEEQKRAISQAYNLWKSDAEKQQIWFERDQ